VLICGNSLLFFRTEIMNRQELLTLFDKEQRIDIQYPDMEKQILPHLVRFVRPAPGMSFILYNDLNGADPDVVIQEQIVYFTERQQPFEWKVYDHDQPAGFRDRLVAAGFEPEEPDAVMVLDLETAPASLLSPPHFDDPAIVIRPITTRAGLADVIRVEERVWGGNFDWMNGRLGGHLDIPGYLSIYVAYVADEPAATGWIYFHPGSNHFASIWGGSTVAKFRKRGLYTALLATRAQEARRRGYHYLTLDASPMSRPITARHGFELLTYAHACEWLQSDE
jgi:hypothetical protein